MTSAPAEQDQTAVVALLAAPATHGGVGPVERIDTHISHLFLIGDRVFKLKRAVRFPYLDFTTRTARHAACEAEVRVNRRTAPTLYLGVAAVLRAGARLRLGRPDEAPGPGEEAVDWLVAMRRFDQATLFDAMATRGALTPALVAELAETIAAFHDNAAPSRDFGGANGMGYALDGILAEIARFTPAIFAPDAAADIDRALRGALAALATLLDARRDAGFVRQGHGDLHLRNICLIDGRPTPFDGIEFNDAIATVDVLYDLAFLLMDLEHRGLRPLANLALNHYLPRRGDYAGLAALPFFLACRAAVRAHVAATQASRPDGAIANPSLASEARDYLALGRAFLDPVAPRLVAVGGLSGTGKTALARVLAPSLGRAPGAVHLRSDVIRKCLFGVDPLTRLGADAYTEAVTRQVYETIRHQAGEALAAGSAVVADAVHARPEERAGIAAVARAAGVPFDGLWLDAPEAVRIERVEGRTVDASDATAAVARAQAGFVPADPEWLRIDASGETDATVAQARKALKLNEKSRTLNR